MCNMAQLVVEKLTELENKQQLLKSVINKNKSKKDIEKEAVAI